MKIKFGSFVTEGRGKINGHVASRNHAGAFLRTKVTPINPRTAAQTGVRAFVTLLSQAWRGLTAAQRTAWIGAVGSFTGTDIFGDKKTPTGFNLYMGLNKNLKDVGQSTLSAPPLAAAVSTVTVTSITSTAGTPTLSIVLSAAVPAGTSVKLMATPGMSAGINFVKSQFRQISTLAAAATTPVNALTAWNAKFGTLVAGQKIFVQLVFVNNTTGQSSKSAISSVIVAA